MSPNRNEHVRRTRLSACLFAAAVLISACMEEPRPADEAKVYHVVLCWLKEPGNSTARQKIIDVSKSFKSIPGVIDVKAGAFDSEQPRHRG